MKPTINLKESGEMSLRQYVYMNGYNEVELTSTETYELYEKLHLFYTNKVLLQMQLDAVTNAYNKEASEAEKLIFEIVEEN